MMLRTLFIAILISTACVSTHGQSPSATPEVGGGPVVPANQGYLVKEIRDGLYWVTDGAYNTMFLVTDAEVIAVDAPPTLGANYLKAIREVTDKPVTVVVYSHEHTDHIGSANLFPKTATVIAQNETAAILARRKDPRRPLPTVTFDEHYTLDVGGQKLELAYTGPNHQTGNILIYAPKQKVLMLVDVVYPGYTPYKNLGIVQDVPGYMEAHRAALKYDFETLVAGHVSRLGTRADVELSLAFVTELKTTVNRQMAATPFPAYARTHRARDKWDVHNEYEKELVNGCYQQLAPKWSARLADTETYLKDNCWAMIEALVVQIPSE